VTSNLLDAPYNPDDTSKQAIRWWCRNSLFYLAQILFPDIVPEPHWDMCAFLENNGTPIEAKLYKENRAAVSIKPNCSLLVGARALLKTSLKQARMVQLGLQNPNLRILDVLSTQTNAETDLSLVRNLFDNIILMQAFPDIIPTEEERKKLPWSAEYVCLKRTEAYPEPTYTAAGIGKNLTSRHYNIIIPDDIVVAKLDYMSAEEIRPSPMDIQKAIGWHQVQLNGLMEMKPTHRGDPEVLYPPQVLSLNNRWSQDDYVDYIERFHPEFSISVYPIKWPETHPTKPNMPTWPAGPRGTIEELDSLERSMSTYIWNTQYLCNPSDPKEHVFSKEWLQFYPIAPHDKIVRKVGMMDLGLSLDKSACYTAAIIVGQDEYDTWYVLDAVREHADTAGQLDMFFNLAEYHKPDIFAMEDVLFQEKMLEIVRADPRYPQLSDWGTVFCGERPTRGESKEQRIEALQPRVRNGQLLLKADQVELIHEMTRYRRNTASTRDLVDALSYIPKLISPATKGVKLNQKAEQSWGDGIPYEEIEAAILGQSDPGIYGYITPDEI